MRWRWIALALLVGGCVTAAAPAPIYMCYRTVDGDGDPLMICEPHDPKGYTPVYREREPHRPDLFKPNL